MTEGTSFGQRMGAGFAAVVALALVIAFVSVFALRAVVAAKDAVIDGTAANLLLAQEVNLRFEQRGAAVRGFLLTGDESMREQVNAANARLEGALGGLEAAGESPALLARIRAANAAHQRTQADVMAARGGASLEEIAARFEREVVPARLELQAVVGELDGEMRRALAAAREDATATADRAAWLTLVLAGVAALLATAVATLLTRSLTRQIGTAASQVQSSSAELQAAAGQQSTGSREQATAMNEIGTTMSELLATSRQISGSARSVVRIADETRGAARTGVGTVERTQAAMQQIRSQVDVVVEHMLDLGRRSQQIGGVVDIVSELAEQTNILAINATIEAAGAGEAGRRFGVVADEIRKLADRVGASTKQIRGQVEDVRTAVNTTVMATETSSKAVDAGARSFVEVTEALGRIDGLVQATTDAAREIELSTQQQSTAVEQVNVAISNVAQATRETEVSASQTLQTAGQLHGLARDLVKLVRPGAA